ncbi:hypothetical protein Salat_1455300 [Sesamum alatum]|uniref:Uncharacterized protein n=1 Tax=Sesamum alatum TaxID=300844 RepID=A0AAE1YAZ4_9LAMI|nr:hypothetical protein Salat_1455300 [Sesamum alatum]
MEDWSQIFPTARVDHLPPLDSNHTPILISTTGKCSTIPLHNQKPFCFEAMWLRPETCERIMAKAWEGGGGLDHRMISLRRWMIPALVSCTGVGQSSIKLLIR